MSSSYIFKVFNNGSYLNESTDLISIRLDSTSSEDAWDFLKVSDIQDVTISDSTLILFKELLSTFDMLGCEAFLLNVGINLQNSFIIFQDSFNDEIFEDFKLEDNEYKDLLNIIEAYLFEESNPLYSISFNFNKKSFSSAPLKQKSVLSDIMNSIIQNLNISVENFHERKTEILSDSIHIKKGKGGEYIRTQFVQILFKLAKSEKPNLSDYSILKFIGCFLHVFQIPYYSTITEIQIDSIEEEIESIDLGLMRLYIDRPKSIFTK